MKGILNGSCGIKRITEDLTNEFVYILDNASKFLVVATYNMTLPDDLWNKLSVNKSLKLAIMPYWYFAKSKYENINSINTINSLIKNNVAVIINSNNHSKFIVAENDFYFGSVNLTERAIQYNVEGAIFSSVSMSNGQVLRNDIIMFVKEEINRYNSLINNSIQIHKDYSGFLAGMTIIYNKFKEVPTYFMQENNQEIMSSQRIKLLRWVEELKTFSDQYEALLNLNDFFNVLRRLKKLNNLTEVVAEFLKYAEGNNLNAKQVKYFNSGEWVTLCPTKVTVTWEKQ